MFNIDKERIMKEIVENKNTHVFNKDIIEYDFNLLYKNDRDKEEFERAVEEIIIYNLKNCCNRIYNIEIKRNEEYNSLYNIKVTYEGCSKEEV